MRDLPPTWQMMPLSRAGRWFGGGTPSKANPSFWHGSIPWVSAKDMKSAVILDARDHISEEAVRSSSTNLVDSGSVLVVVRSGILQHTLPVAVTGRQVALNQDLKAVKPTADLLPQYLALALRTFEREILHECSKEGTTVQSLNMSSFLRYEIPVPPMKEQRRIVAEIEKQFTRLEDGVTSLQRSRDRITTHRAVILSRAFPTRSLPDGWAWSSPQELSLQETNAICAGPFGTIFKAKDFRSEGVPIIFLRHVRAGRFSTEKPGFMDTTKWNELFKPYSVFGGELLVTKLGEPPGVCAIYPQGVGPAMVTPDVIKMTVNTKLVAPLFLMHYFNSEGARRASAVKAFGTTRLRLTIPMFRDMPVPLPTLDEQMRIVAEVERRFSVLDNVERVVQTNLKRAKTLRLSILHKAFSGQL